MRPALLAPGLLALALAAACGSTPAGTAGAGPASPAAPGTAAPVAGADVVAVAAGDRECTVAVATVPAGPRTFTVKNTGSDVTEVYLYARGSDGQFDKVVQEVENVGPGISRSFSAELTAGSYQVTCKPGMKGAGIRTPLTVTGPTVTGPATAPAAAPAEEKYDREVRVAAKEYAFTGLAGFTAKVGEKIEFQLQNDGAKEHELEVFGPDGKAVGEVGPTAAGRLGEVVLTLAEPGTYRYESGVADDAERGLKGTFTVR